LGYPKANFWSAKYIEADLDTAQTTEMSELINKAMRRKPVVWEDGQIFPVEEASIKKLTWVVACPGNGSS